ncbi:DUF3727 domain-containing protein [Floridanema evergladense]|uniref:DUF3727 domain-containing protein n=1 Tax=Floridaenema evergladense BLCC-F167 TaxID=3153639 RepID=A0ABV4WDJ8_9CYAN
MSENSDNFYSEDGEEIEIVSLIDRDERELLCYIEEYIEAEDDEYLVLRPVDIPVEIFVSEPDSEQISIVEDEAIIQEIYPIAQAVLAENNLSLKPTPFILTVEGELPPPDEENILTLVIEEEDANPMQPPIEPEELQLVAYFHHKDQEYCICSPLDPLIFFGRFNQRGNAELLSEEEYKKVQPLLKELMSNQME